ncbi:hypothetical protein TNCV_804381 [Trichonephila clavipes]|nr:hypothetical protein TNCV_804381 [Trichonephila clavipes]
MPYRNQLYPKPSDDRFKGKYVKKSIPHIANNTINWRRCQKSVFDSWCFVSAVELNGKIYAIGGFDGSEERSKTAECFTPENNQVSRDSTFICIQIRKKITETAHSESDPKVHSERSASEPRRRNAWE